MCMHLPVAKISPREESHRRRAMFACASREEEISHPQLAASRIACPSRVGCMSDGFHFAAAAATHSRAVGVPSADYA